MLFRSKQNTHRCSFCSKPAGEVNRLVARDRAAICGGCTILTLYSVLRDQEPTENELLELAKVLEPYGAKQDSRPYVERFHDMVSSTLQFAGRGGDN